MTSRTPVDRFHPQVPVTALRSAIAVAPPGCPQTLPIHGSPLAAILPSPWPLWGPLHSLLFQTNEHASRACVPLRSLTQTGLRFLGREAAPQPSLLRWVLSILIGVLA